MPGYRTNRADSFPRLPDSCADDAEASIIEALRIRGRRIRSVQRDPLKILRDSKPETDTTQPRASSRWGHEEPV